MRYLGLFVYSTTFPIMSYSICHLTHNLKLHLNRTRSLKLSTLLLLFYLLDFRSALAPSSKEYTVKQHDLLLQKLSQSEGLNSFKDTTRRNTLFRSPLLFLRSPSSNTSLTRTHCAVPAGSWWLAWCCHRGSLGGVCTKRRGVNWVSAGCKALCDGLVLFLLMFCHSHTPMGYKWWGRWRCRGDDTTGDAFFLAQFNVYLPILSLLLLFLKSCLFLLSGRDLYMWWKWPRVNRFTS